MSTVDTPDLTEEQLKARGALVRALWNVDNKGREFGSSAERHQAFVEERPPYVQKANQVMRQLQNMQVYLIMS